MVGEKPKKHYLIAHWCSARGGSREHPNEYIGTMAYFPKTLDDIDLNRCYTSEYQATKVCEKLCTYHWWAEVVEV